MQCGQFAGSLFLGQCEYSSKAVTRNKICQQDSFFDNMIHDFAFLKQEKTMQTV